MARFEISESYAQRFEIHAVGAFSHRELWVPANQLEEFNSHLLGPISVASSYFGGSFSGEVDQESGLPAHVADVDRAMREIRDG